MSFSVCTSQKLYVLSFKSHDTVEAAALMQSSNVRFRYDHYDMDHPQRGVWFPATSLTWLHVRSIGLYSWTQYRALYMVFIHGPGIGLYS